MPWFEKEIDYARQSLEAAAERAVGHAATELRDVIKDAGREIDGRLDKISDELHEQRQFTKDDVRELVDYAADRLASVMDERIAVMKREITSLVTEKVEYFKTEVDAFFVQRQDDLARERRRLMANVAIAVATSILVALVSWLYYRYMGGRIDLFGVFRIAFASLSGGYAVYLIMALLRRWMRMSEHRKDAVYVAMRYWGVLHPESIFGNIILLVTLVVVSAVLLVPEVFWAYVETSAVWHWLRTLLAPKG